MSVSLAPPPTTGQKRVLAKLGRAFDLAHLFDLPDDHPDPMIAASNVLYVGVRIIIIVIMVWNHWNATDL